MARVGVDTGGTFTDCVFWDDDSGQLLTAKVPSQPSQPEAAVAEGVARLLAAADVEPTAIQFLVHGTTVATNAALTGELAAVGLLTNRGFRDVLEIGTQQRPALYSLRQVPRPTLVPRERRLEIQGRIAFDGREIEPLDEDEIARAAAQLAAFGVEGIAIAMLFAFVNPTHERRVEEIVRATVPGLYVARSSAVCPELREYPRFATTAANVALAPLLDRYIGGLDAFLRRGGHKAPLHVMQSNGGIATAARSIGENAHRLVLSGPAAGVIGGAYVATAAGLERVITLDMGGTSADIGVVVQGQARMRAGLTLPNGIPLQIPSLEVEAIGAGGGSIARVDAGGALRVGPQSAGAKPGPACYGLTGSEATVTDAHLLLGRLDPGSFLGGAVPLYSELARQAIERHVASPLGCSVEEAARGVIAVAEANMAGAIRRVAARHGDDLREFTLLAAGGAGPLHGVALAAELGMAAVCVPATPGLLSALGLLATDLRHDLAAPLIAFAADLAPDRLEHAFGEIEAEAMRLLEADGLAPEQRQLERAVDLRTVGQEWTLSVPLDRGEPFATVTARFHQLHERLYGHAAPEEPIESVAIRVVARGKLPRPLIADASGTAGPGPAPQRKVWFAEAGGFVTSRIYSRAELGPAAEIDGPAVVQQLDTTVLIPPGYRAVGAAMNSLVIRRVEHD